MECINLINDALAELNQNDDFLCFFEKWDRGKPSREKLIRRDFHHLWMEDNLHRFPMLQIIRESKKIIPVKVKSNGKIRTITLRYKPIGNA